VRTAPDGERFPLPAPAETGGGPGFFDVLATRRSSYRYSDDPITIDQLGAFLHQTARVQETFSIPVANRDGRTGTMEVSRRPYPSGGRSYELELYISVDACAGLARGLYYYQPVDHCLIRLRDADRTVEELLSYAAIASPGNRPQILITLAARFGRVAWKYDAIAYATTLKHVGVLMQTMYLTATALGLGGTALGSGNADLFAAAIGTDYFAETSVGEFMLGSVEPAG